MRKKTFKILLFCVYGLCRDSWINPLFIQHKLYILFIRISGYQDIRISGYQDIRISGYQDIRISGY